jgi:hypothetical protein
LSLKLSLKVLPHQLLPIGIQNRVKIWRLFSRFLVQI